MLTVCAKAYAVAKALAHTVSDGVYMLQSFSDGVYMLQSFSDGVYMLQSFSDGVSFGRQALKGTQDTQNHGGLLLKQLLYIHSSLLE